MTGALMHAWENTLRRHGDRRALVHAADGSTFTFREIDGRADAWRARVAPGAGALAGRTVVFAEPNGVGWFEIFIGLRRAGAIAVPLDAGEPPAARREIAAALRAGFFWDGARLVPLSDAKHHRAPAICLVKLTSGTTGRPRPLAFTDGQLIADAQQIAKTMRISPRDLNYGLIPLGHSYGLGNLTVPLLVHGVPLVCGSAPLPQAIAADFARWRPTVFPGVPAVWNALAASGVRLASLRLGISAGAPLSPEVARAFAEKSGRRLHAFYGSTETGGIAYDATGAATLVGGVGRALRSVKLIRLPGQRLLVSSPAVFTRGNRRRAGGCGAWIMADRVVQDGRGALTLLGRRGTAVKIAGRRVDLVEVAARLRRLPGVRDVWVGVSAGREPVLGAAVVCGCPVAELRAALGADTPAWKIPKRWAVVAVLPMTLRGKINAPALQGIVFGRSHEAVVRDR